MHMHSTFSYDGKVSLEDLREQLIQVGVSFACMSEHTDELKSEQAAAFVAKCRELSGGGFIFVPGFEVPYREAHILMFGATDFLGQFADETELQAWRVITPLVILAHPIRNKFIVDKIMNDVIDGVEIWNQQYDGKRVPRTEAYALLERLRKDNPNLIATGGLDYHRREHLTYPRVSIELEALSESAIIAALKQGSFTFGDQSLQVHSHEPWADAYSTFNRLKSQSSIAVITAGKWVNKTLKSLGLSLPSSIKRSIRSRV